MTKIDCESFSVNGSNGNVSFSVEMCVNIYQLGGYLRGACLKLRNRKPQYSDLMIGVSEQKEKLFLNRMC